MSTEVSTQVAYSQMERMAASVAKSGLFGVKTPEQALSLMLIAQAEGMHPAVAARDYHIIQGRPALKADTMLARFHQAGGKVEWGEYTDQKVTATFSHPQSGKVAIEWTIDRAKQAGLTAKDNWKSYPRQMLRSRVVSEGVRTCYPGVAIGTYTVEEVQDMEPERDVTPQKIETAVQESVTAHALTADEVNEHLAAIRDAEPGEALRAVYAAACTHANQAKDKAAKEQFIAAYNARKEAA